MLAQVSLTLAAGSAMAVIGPSGSGKSSLARALVGLWTPAAGAIRLDGARLGDWPADALPRHIGYMPQDIELLPGTVAQKHRAFRHDHRLPTR